MQLTGFLYLFLATFSSALMAIFLKAFQSDTDNRYGILVGNYITCLVLALVVMPDRSLLLHPQPATLVCGLVCGVLFVACLIVMQSSIRANGAILTSAFGKLGLLIPLAAGILVLHETPTPIQWVGIVLVIAAILMINRQEDNQGNASRSAGDTATDDNSANVSASRSTRGLLLLLLVLLISGFADGMAKVFEQVGERSQDTLYIFIVFLVAGLFAFALMILETKKTGRKVSRNNLLAGITVGIPNYFSSLLLLKTLAKLPAFITYPAFSTGAILIVTLVSTVAFKEKPGKAQILGLGMILVALILLNI